MRIKNDINPNQMMLVISQLFSQQKIIPFEKYTHHFQDTIGNCVRWRIPLKLAWAITVHRPQCMNYRLCISCIEYILC